VPRRVVEVDEDEAPPRRRRRSAKAVAIEAEPERGLAMRVLLYSPKDMVAGVLAFAAVTAIVTNALFLQAGPHPSPMFGSVVVMPAVSPTSGPAPSAATQSVSPLPRPRPVEITPQEPRQGEFKPLEPKPEVKAEAKVLEVKPPEAKVVEPRTAPDPMTGLVKATTASMPPISAPATTSTVLRPPAPIPMPHTNSGLLAGGSRRVAAVQRALTEFGYGQLRPSGIEGPDTKAALVKFERDRRLPVTAQISDRLVHELSAMTGRPIN
jgi:Putative peptidoglycan binding domain